MKRILLSLLFCAGIILSLSAQNRLITTGVLAEQQGNIEKAIETLEQALSQPENLKEKLIPKGQYYLYRAYFRVVADTTLKELRNKYPNALQKAKENLVASTTNKDYGDKYEKQAILENAFNNIWAQSYNLGIVAFRDGDYAKAKEYFQWADEVNKDDFLTARMLGTCSLAMQDTAAAMTEFQSALDIFQEKYGTPYEGMEESADYQNAISNASYLYEQSAVILQAQGKTNEALELLSEGLAKFPNDDNLKRQRLNIFQRNPELFEEAREEFETMIEENPEDENLKVAYAQMLMDNGYPQEGKKLFDEIYEKNPESLGANFGLGAYYINQVVEINEEKAKLNDEEKIAEMDKTILDYLERAYPYMQFLHKEQPDRVEWLQQLLTISSYLGLDEETMEYSKKLNDLRSGSE